MSRMLLGLCLGLLVSVNSYASIDDKVFAKCAVIDGDLERLECFDTLARDKKLNGSQTQPVNITGKGKWLVNIKENPIDDSKTVSLMLDATSGRSKWKGSVYLIARCQSNKTDVYIGWNDYLGREANVLTRIGKQKAVTQKWAMSTDRKATFHNRPISFLKAMLKSNKLVAQITPYNENPVTAVFDTSGLVNAIAPLRETCGW